jgi:hypothetical protein
MGLQAVAAIINDRSARKRHTRKVITVSIFPRVAGSRQ